MVRKLRGPVKKESKEERRMRRAENVEGKQKILSIAIPVLIAVVLLIGLFVYLGVREK